MKTIKIQSAPNNFHNKIAKILIPENETFGSYFKELLWLDYNGDKKAARRLNDLKNKVCGVKDCQCGIEESEESEES